MPISECHLSGNGAVAALEGRLRAFYGVRHALCVSSASMGLLAVGVALSLRRSDFVTTPYTYGGTLSGWLLLSRYSSVRSTTCSMISSGIFSGW